MAKEHGGGMDRGYDVRRRMTIEPNAGEQSISDWVIFSLPGGVDRIDSEWLPFPSVGSRRMFVGKRSSLTGLVPDFVEPLVRSARGAGQAEFGIDSYLLVQHRQGT